MGGQEEAPSSEISLDNLIKNCPRNKIIGDNLIRAWSIINKDKYKKVLCTISGGADSDIMLDICSKVDKDHKIEYVWFDTGLEYQATKEHLKYLSEKYSIEIKTYKSKKPIPWTCINRGVPFLNKRTSNYIQRLQKHGFKFEDKPFEELYVEYPKCKAALSWWCNLYQSDSFNIRNNKWLKEFLIANPPDFPISDLCCQYTKKDVLHKLIKEEEYDLNMAGLRKAEGGVRANAFKNCFDEKTDCDDYRPIFWYTEAEKKEYEQHYGIEHSRCYSEYGLKRTGCAGCPFGRDFETELEAIQKYEPQLYKAVNNIFGKSYEYTRKFREFQKENNEKEKQEKAEKKLTENKYTPEDLKTMQEWSLERKIQVTQTRIIEWYKHWDGMVYISFSGGKDSTVLLDLARRIYPDIKAVFVDTGLEYPELRDYVKTIDNVTWLKPKMNFKQVIMHYGYPIITKEQSSYIEEYKNTNSEKLRDIRINGNKWGRGKISKKWQYLINAPFKISDKCCDVMKKNPAKEFEKETGLHPIIGTMTEESLQRKSNWLAYGCNAFTKKRPTSQPMSFWTEQDVLEYLKKFDVPYASVYGDIVEEEGVYHTTGCPRTGCVFCGFGCHLEKEPNRFQKLKETHPKLWNYCMKSIDDGGLGLKEVLEYINVKIE